MKKIIDGMEASYTGSGGHILNDEQIELAKKYGMSFLAHKIRDKQDKDGEKWFTEASVSSSQKYLHQLTECNIITKVITASGGIYYKHTIYTRPWCHTAVAYEKEKWMGAVKGTLDNE
jgi:hypothetical protein